MEAIIILVFAYFISKKAISNSYAEIENLPVGSNSKGYYNSEAFTEIYLSRRGSRDN